VPTDRIDAAQKGFQYSSFSIYSLKILNHDRHGSSSDFRVIFFSRLADHPTALSIEHFALTLLNVCKINTDYANAHSRVMRQGRIRIPERVLQKYKIGGRCKL
jgi:hypothetical protein